MQLAFSEDGPGPVVVLLHGFPFDRTMWSNQRSILGSSYRLIIPDLRGHGSTAAPDGIYTIDAMADDVVELLDGLQIFEPIVIGGHSMGGYIALSIVVRDADRVRGSILINTHASADTTESAGLREKSASEIEVTGDTGPYLESMIPRLFSKETFERHPDIIARLSSRMAKTPARAIVGMLRGLANRPDRTVDLPKIVTPTLVLAGGVDQLISAQESERMTKLIPQARLITISQSGHLAPLENPSETNLNILHFLEELAM